MKSLFSPHLNDIQYDNKFHIPADIQRRFKRIMFWRTMLKNPFLWEQSAQKAHEDMMAYIERNGWTPSDADKPDALNWDDINANKEFFYQEYIRKQKPCVIKNAPYDKNVWTTEHIRSLWGDNPMVVHDLANNIQTNEMTLNEMIEFNKSGAGCAYMSFNRTFFDTNKNLLETMCAEPLHGMLKKRRKLNGELRIDAQLFISTESTHPTRSMAYSFLHCANNINMFFNAEGRKRWVLINPEFSLCAYPSTNFRGTGAFFSLIKAPKEAEQEKSRFPLYDYCPKYQVDLEEGDILFVPCWWWHSVETLTPATLSVAVRFGPTVFGSLFPGDMKDPNTLFTTLQVLYPGLKKEIFDTLRTRIRSKQEQYDGTTLRQLDLRQEVEKDYDIKLTLESDRTVRMWRDCSQD